MLLAIMSLVFIGVLGVVAGTAMTTSTTVFIAAVSLAIVFAVVLALALETIEVADESPHERKR